jgi:thiosulfate/3-mercaptopyruvate sulfurtransferase
VKQLPAVVTGEALTTESVPFTLVDASPAGGSPATAKLSVQLLFGPSGDPAQPALVDKLLARAGVPTSQPIVVADGGAAVYASQVVFALHCAGYVAAVLDGDIRGRTLTGTSPQDEAFGRFPDSQAGPAVIARAEETKAAVEAGVQILDVRTQEEYDGYDPHGTPGGHIPTAVHVEWVNNLIDTAEGRRWRSPHELKDIYVSRGLDPKRRTIVYCYAGPRAMSAYIGLRHAGFTDVSVYVRGWREWSALNMNIHETKD